MEEYYSLTELLVFSVQLPAYGYSKTVDLLQLMPITPELKKRFESKLVEVRNIVATDV